ncbi:MAG: HEAT repeat domain-containing protein [Pirellulales bacterium]|nr:HEAT repeat domain-containing protein [Pirellulales bacterium]
MNQSEPELDDRLLVDQLYDPHARRAARQKLVRARAVKPLLECLSATNEAVVWSAVESLGELRAPEAVGPLVDLLARGVLVVSVCEALTRITGQDFGADVRRWQQWLAASGGNVAPGLDVAECIRATGQHLGVEAAGSGKTYQFKLSLPNDREQKVTIFFGREDNQGEPIVVVYSECGPAEAKYYEAVLRKNLTIPAGAFAIRDIDGKPNFVLVDTVLAALVTPSVLAKRIEHIAARADAVEKSLTQEDRR